MLLVARKNLFGEKTRLAISVGGVAISVFLIAILLSLYRGWDQRVGGFVEQVPADLWVASDGSADFAIASSVLPQELHIPLGSSPDVQTVSPLIVRPMEVSREQDPPTKTFDLQMVGYDPSVALGGPLSIVTGKSAPGAGEIIIDEQMHKRHNVNIGDQLVRGTKSLSVVGYSAGGDFVYTQVGFVTIDTAIGFLALDPPGQRSFFVIKLKDGTNVDSAAASLAQMTPGVKFIKPADFAHDTRKRILGNILPILIVVLIISFIVGLAVAALTIYTATIEKSREYGILKAEGFTNGYLYRVVFEQSLVTGLLGFLIGAGLTVLVAPFAQQNVPQFVVFVRWQDICAVAGATLIMSLLAAYIPVRRLTNIDPVSVFKG